MDRIQISALTFEGKGRVSLIFEDGEKATLYKSELAQAASLEGRRILLEGEYIRKSTYEAIFDEIVSKRAKKRALHLLEQMDRSERQLRDKLALNGYPGRTIDDAIDYLKGFRYIDDEAFARRYIEQVQDVRSAARIRLDLTRKGVSRDVIDHAIETSYTSDDTQKIASLIEKRHYSKTAADEKERAHMFRYLASRGFRSSDILKAMNG
jgi:regulatory protein